MTHTYATLVVSEAAYDEVARILTDAGYMCINEEGEIDMHGIALVKKENGPNWVQHAPLKYT